MVGSFGRCHRAGALADNPEAVRAPDVYTDILGRLGCTVDAWETTYLHVLPGDDPVVEWFRAAVSGRTSTRSIPTGAASSSPRSRRLPRRVPASAVRHGAAVPADLRGRPSRLSRLVDMALAVATAIASERDHEP